MKKKDILFGAFLLCLPLLFSLNASLKAEEVYGLRNEGPQTEESEGRIILLPSGHRINPWVHLPEGWIISDDGSVISEEGIVIKKDGTIENPLGTYPEGYVVGEDGSIRTPEGFVIGKKKKEGEKEEKPLPEGAKVLQDGTIVLKDGTKITPKGEIVKKEEKILVPKSSSAEVPVDEDVGPLWSMLPLTPVKEKEEKAVKENAKKGEKKQAEKGKEEKKGKGEKEPKKMEKPGKEKEQARTPRIGEKLHIPPEAVKTGNLDFLEGCWQGTRPEYYSKRTVYECFCFGKNGRNGKRKVIDPQGGRRCLGSTHASLNSGGVLSVSSQGAVCSDGQKWGSAEMTCRGKGQNTPCSWYFKDAQGGRQSYSIPFVRVQSCGRR